MVKYLVVAVAVCTLAGAAGTSLNPSLLAQSGGPRLATCLHGQNETSEQSARRERAIKVAQAINAAQVVVVGPQKPKYRRPEELMNVPSLPQGFALQFNTDSATYNFAIKDTLDACHFAIYSDQDKFVYATTPMMNARIVPVATK